MGEQKGKKSGNGKDDDKNGYIDDVHGWSFLGSKAGNVHYEALELTRLVRRDRARFDHLEISDVKEADLKDYTAYLVNKNTLEERLLKAKVDLEYYEMFKNDVENTVVKMGKTNPSYQDFVDFVPTTNRETNVRKYLLPILSERSFETYFQEQILGGYEHAKEEVEYSLNIDFNPRSIVGDDINNPREQFYGNTDVAGPDAMHGSHVAGIIAADRNNGIGIKGVANHVAIMAVRCTPSGDERDKDVANAIRYAVDNGAKVINMSFGKGYATDKNVVDDAVKYAVAKDVLLIHAAGNENKNLEEEPNFPNFKYEDGGTAASWLTVGASGWDNDGTIKASFSNYGKTTVDVFAPGVDLNSTVPGSKYQALSGTSMAAPVVAGLAALIRSYYPNLTAVQVKDIIMQSVVKVEQKVLVMQHGKNNELAFTDLCVTGGIVNAYNALKLAATYAK